MNIGGEDISLDPTASKNVTAFTNEAVNQPVNDYSSDASLQGRGLLGRADSFNQNIGSPESAAIKSRYTQAFNRNEYQLDTKSMQNASMDKIKKLQNASALAGQEVEMNKQKEVLKYKIDQANKKARGAILGTVLGIVGGGAGAWAGGPAGAMAGMAAGEGVGNAIGGS